MQDATHLSATGQALAEEEKSAQSMTDVPSMTEEEFRHLLSKWNNTAKDYSQIHCLNRLIETQVEQTPDIVAVTFENTHLTYRELNERANRVAHYLQRAGVGPEVLVGVYMERSLELVIALVSILKAGGAYVPLDPIYPQERLAFMLEEIQAPIVLTQAYLVSTLPPHSAQTICLDTEWELVLHEDATNPVNNLTPDNLAYVIYTSGSTGKPKGAMNTQRGICNRLLWMQDAYQLTETDRVLQKTPFSFDVSVWEFFWPLITGARLVVARPEGHKDSGYLISLIIEQQITTLHFVPSMLQIFLEEPRIEACRSLRQVFCSGEALPVELQERFFSRHSADLHNLYGPTEAAVDVTFWACKRNSSEQTVPIGYPIANTQIYILDQDKQSVPIGVPGELYIGGVGVARGYLNRPELTQERFVANPFSATPGERLYRTGDLARYRADGAIEYLGRLDHQVKLRGYRIELGEIEAVLRRHPAVREAVVLLREDTADDKRLVAYFVQHTGQTASRDDLQRHVLASLPNYMLPSAFVQLDALPLNANGKVDLRALPAPDQIHPELTEAFIAPRTPIEKIVAAIWREVLNIEQIAVHDNFFALGGHSLLANRMIAHLCSQLGVEIPLRAFFEAPTVAQLAERLQDTATAAAPTRPALRARPRIAQRTISSPPEFIME